MDRGYRCSTPFLEVGQSEGKIIIFDMICFEHLILALDKLIEWTGIGKKDKFKIREEVLAAVENHSIND